MDIVKKKSEYFDDNISTLHRWISCSPFILVMFLFGAIFLLLLLLLFLLFFCPAADIVDGASDGSFVLLFVLRGSCWNDDQIVRVHLRIDSIGEKRLDFINGKRPTNSLGDRTSLATLECREGRNRVKIIKRDQHSSTQRC